MGRKKISYWQVRCDYPDHEGFDRELGTGDEYHNLEGDFVVCKKCWNDKIVVEKLLKMLDLYHHVLKVGQEK